MPFLPSSLLALALICAAAVSARASGADPVRALREARGSQRVLLVFAPDDAALHAQRQLWKDDGAAFAERDLVILPCLADDPAARPLAQRFGIPARDFCVVLVGKDGHDARRFSQPVAAAEITRTIDAMPMRQAEMKARASH